MRVEDRQGAVRLGRYMIRCPIVLKRLSWERKTGEIIYRGRPSRHSGARLGRTGSRPPEVRWDVLEFLARVIDHIPEPSQQTVRYWGYYANAARGKRRKAAEAGVTSQTSRRQDDDEFTRSSRLTWAKLIRRVYPDSVAPLGLPRSTRPRSGRSAAPFRPNALASRKSNFLLCEPSRCHRAAA